MASISILLFTSKILKDGTHPVFLRITKDRVRKYFSMGYSATKNQWLDDDEIGGKFSSDVPHSKNKNKALIKQFWRAEEIISEFEADGKDWTMSDFQDKFQEVKPKDVFEYFDTKIAQMKEIGKIGNSYVYRDTKRVLLRFHNEKSLQFGQIDFRFLTRLEHFLLKNGFKETSISLHFRTLRALLNAAIKEKLCKAEYYPFKEYQISKLDHSTQKRALPKAQIDKIFDVEPDPESKQLLSKHMFMFSFFNMGMNFHDMAQLRWTDITGERINYKRTKTGKLFSIKILPPVQEIINFYREHNANSSYVFPILDETYPTLEKRRQRITSGLRTFNKHLKIFAKQVELEGKLTSYVSRHSWATILKRMGVSTTVISEGLGHASEKTTQVYLDSFENETLDRVNLGLWG